jgi:hypothetical protein
MYYITGVIILVTAATAAATVSTAAATASRTSAKSATAAGTSAASGASAACAEFFLRPCFIDGNCLAVKHSAIEFLNRFRRAFFRFHFDKAETFGLAAEFVFNDCCGRNFSRFTKVGFKIFIRDLIRQVADIQILVHFNPLSLNYFLISSFPDGAPQSIKITPIRLPVEKEGKSEGLVCLTSGALKKLFAAESEKPPCSPEFWWLCLIY